MMGNAVETGTNVQPIADLLQLSASGEWRKGLVVDCDGKIVEIALGEPLPENTPVRVEVESRLRAGVVRRCLAERSGFSAEIQLTDADCALVS